MANNRLSLSREQLATFLKNHEQIKQFERLFAIANEVSPSSDTTGISIQAGNADAAATEALAQIVRLAQDAAINSGAADQKAVQALDTLGRIANALEMLATAPVIQNNNSVVVDYIDLPEIGPHVGKERRIQWNRDDGTMGVGLYGGNVLQVGQESMYYAKNTSGGLVTRGTPVMFTGTDGASGKLTFGPAIADGSVLADYMMGVAAQDIANNEFGYVTSFGLVRGFDTTGAPYGEVWNDGDLLYFDPATPGTWTKVKPVAPAIDVPVAVVINAADDGSGSIFVRMKIADALSRLQDVHIVAPSAGQVLIYDATQQRWENHHLTAGSNIQITNADGSITIAVTGLGTMATQNSNNVAITGGSISGVTLTGAEASGTWGISVTGNAATATKLQTARTLTIGNTGKSFDGSGNVSWSLAEIGAPSTNGTGATGTWGISISGNAATATKLQTARTINGTSFNGSANITTANWGTARTITIGNTGKSVNGSANVSWSLAEIGAARFGILADGTDLNTVVEPGFYRLRASHGNAPAGVAYGQLIVARGGGDTILQIVTGYANGEIYWRQGNPPDTGGAGSWSPWHRFYHSGNLGLGTMAFQNTGASGSFTTADGKTVTVVNGVITSIEQQSIPTVQLVTPVDGFNYVVANPNDVRGWVILRPPTTLAVGTVTLPPPSVLIDGMEFTFNTTHQITSFNIVPNGAFAVYGAPLVLAAEDWFSIRYDRTTNSWYRVV